MARQVNWFLNGWEYADTCGRSGKKRRVMVYKGAYYSFGLTARGLALLKTGYLVSTLALFAAFWIYSTDQTRSGAAFYSGVPCMLAIIPFIYLGMGVFCLTIAKSDMTYRSFYASVKRIKYSAIISVALVGVSVLGRVVYIVIHSVEELRGDIAGLAPGVFCVAVLGALLFMHRRFPVGVAGKKS